MGKPSPWFGVEWKGVFLPCDKPVKNIFKLNLCVFAINNHLLLVF